MFVRVMLHGSNLLHIVCRSVTPDTSDDDDDDDDDDFTSSSSSSSSSNSSESNYESE